MKANVLLETQHREIQKLFSSIEDADRLDEKTILFEELAAKLAAHDAIEREIFYPACEEVADDDKQMLDEAIIEHGTVEFCLFRADLHREHDTFDAYLKALKEVVEHHLKEEEKELLPEAKRKLGAERLEELGAQMAQRFEEALASDFRKPLRENLEQTLAGKTKTKTAKRKPARKPTRHRRAA